MRHIIGATCLGVYAAATTIAVSNPSFEDSTSWTSLSTGSNEFWAAPGGSSYATRVAGETATQQVDLGVTIKAGTTYTIEVYARSWDPRAIDLLPNHLTNATYKVVTAELQLLSNGDMAASTSP